MSHGLITPLPVKVLISAEKHATMLTPMTLPRKALTETELQDALATLDGWTIADGKLHKSYKFPSFARAIGWMMSAAVEADKLDHHPEWTNVYNRVEVDLITHDMGNKISTWDIALAQKFDTLL